MLYITYLILRFDSYHINGRFETNYFMLTIQSDLIKTIYNSIVNISFL